jgi:hypothetical protein
MSAFLLWPYKYFIWPFKVLPVLYQNVGALLDGDIARIVHENAIECALHESATFAEFRTNYIRQVNEWRAKAGVSQ